MEGTKKIKSTSFHHYSRNSEVETTWISLIGWPHKTSSMYIVCSAYVLVLRRSPTLMTPASKVTVFKKKFSLQRTVEKACQRSLHELGKVNCTVYIWYLCCQTALTEQFSRNSRNLSFWDAHWLDMIDTYMEFSLSWTKYIYSWIRDELQESITMSSHIKYLKETGPTNTIY